MSGFLRIKRKTQRDGLNLASVDAQAGGYDEYLSRLLKLIPTEVIALYLVGKGLIPVDQREGLLVWSLIALAGVVVVRAKLTRVPPAGPQWGAVCIASISFAIWLYSLGGVFEMYGLHVPWVGSLLVLTWTFFLPYLYKGD